MKDYYSLSYFSENKYSDTNSLKKEYIRRIKLIKKFIPDNGSDDCLDFGCGIGDFVTFSENPYKFKGVDYSDDAIDKAMRTYNKSDCKFYKYSEFFRDNNKDIFDCITIWDVIEHLEDPIKTLQLLSHKLKDGGYLFISTPDIGSLFSRISGKFWPFMTPPEHLSFFTDRSFRKMAEITGFEIVSSQNMGKTANLGFILYKIKRIIPWLVPQSFIDLFRKGILSKIYLYVPTGDIKYLVLKKS